MGLVAPRHVGSSQTRARTRVPCIGRQILNHCATREARTSFFMAEEYSMGVWIHHILVIHSSMDRHLGCFYFLAVVNNVAVNAGIQVSVQVLVFSPLGCIPRSGIARSYENHLFSKVVTPFYTGNVREFQFLHFLLNTCYSVCV